MRKTNRMEYDDATVLARYPSIRIDHVNKELYRGYLRHELVAGHCLACLRWGNPLRPMCPSCWSTEVVPKPVSGKGVVHTLTLLHQGPPIVDYSPPWPVAGIELDEQPGLRVAATLTGTDPQRLRVGQRVELTWVERDKAPWPAFRAVGA
jgi:uncharacterized OB-fold protein